MLKRKRRKLKRNLGYLALITIFCALLWVFLFPNADKVMDGLSKFLGL
jgi:hypothetical protein